jgi:hypothetical protein
MAQDGCQILFILIQLPNTLSCACSRSFCWEWLLLLPMHLDWAQHQDPGSHPSMPSFAHDPLAAGLQLTTLASQAAVTASMERTPPTPMLLHPTGSL